MRTKIKNICTPLKLLIFSISLILATFVTIRFSLKWNKAFEVISGLNINPSFLLVSVFLATLLILIACSYLFKKLIDNIADSSTNKLMKMSYKHRNNKVKKQLNNKTTSDIYKRNTQLFTYLDEELKELSEYIDIAILKENIAMLQINTPTINELKSVERKNQTICGKTPDLNIELNIYDILHLGWNIWYLANNQFKQSQIAVLLKKSFPKSLIDNEIPTIIRKLTKNDIPTYIRLISKNK